MVTKLPRRTSFSGPALVRLLSRLARVEVVEPRQSPAARLDEWLGWTESIVLSTALNAAAPVAAGRAAEEGAKAGGPVGADAHDGVIDDVEFADAEYAKVRQTLEQAIAAAVAPPAPLADQRRRQVHGASTTLADVDFPSYRRRYSMLQQKMESSIAALRGRLRAVLAAGNPEMARLAAVDAAMEQAMAEHELRLLAGVPNLLERRFQSLAQEGLVKPATPRREEGADEAESAAADPLQTRLRRAASKPELEPGPWLDAFRDDMRSVLLAELDLRLQPIEGLLSAIRAR